MSNLKEKRFRPKAMPSKRNKGPEYDETQAYRKNIPDNRQQIEDKTQKLRVDNDSIAKDIIHEGYIQSYIDFLAITNRDLDPGPISLGNEYQRKVTHFSDKELLHLKMQLIKSEQACQYHFPNKILAIEEYYTLADKFFEDNEDYLIAAYFYKRVVHISKSIEEDLWEGKGQLGCGKCYNKMGKIDEAIQILERSLADADRKGLDDLMKEISKELITIYKKMASVNEKENKSREALEYYEKCLEVAKKLQESDNLGIICHQMGLLYYKDGQYEKARDYQLEFLNYINSKDNQSVGGSNKNNLMDAFASLAKCYIKLNESDKALEHLQLYYTHAQGHHNQRSDASLHLAKLWAQKGDIEKSNTFYKEHFKEAKDEKIENKKRKLVDAARVTVGIALANSSIDKYIDLVKNSDKNLKALLDWKCRKPDNK